jgi:hypothetical protein
VNSQRRRRLAFAIIGIIVSLVMLSAEAQRTRPVHPPENSDVIATILGLEPSQWSCTSGPLQGCGPYGVSYFCIGPYENESFTDLVLAQAKLSGLPEAQRSTASLIATPDPKHRYLVVYQRATWAAGCD